MKKYPILIPVCCLFLIAGCSKPKPRPYVPVSPVILTHFSFKEGSYWVYKDSIKGSTDSFYVKSNNEGTIVSYINIIQKNIDTPGVRDSILWNLSLADSEITMDIGALNARFAVTYPFRIDSPIGSSFFYVPAVYTVYSLNRFSFQNVAKISTAYPLNIDYYNYTYYISDSTGIVKMSLIYPFDTVENRIWELVRYSVIK